MLSLVAAISEKIGLLSSHNELEKRPQLRRNNRIRSIHSSLKIEANSLSLSDVRSIINGQTVTGPLKEIQEVKNAYAAYEKIPEIVPSSIFDLKRLHGIMTRGTVESSGEFRTTGEEVFSGGRCIFMAPPPDRVEWLVKDLLSWLRRSEGMVHPLIAAAVFHYELVFIHPFADGNGRMARLWHTVILYRWRSIFQYLPLESQIERCQEEYYRAIADSNNAGNSTVLVEFMLTLLDKLLDESLLQLRESPAETGIYVRKLLDVMEYEVPYSAQELLLRLKLKSKETLRRHYLHPALAQGLIRMSLPDKPQSKNQRYIKQ